MPLLTYAVVLKKQPNRFNTLFGAGLYAVKLNNREKAIYYYQQLRGIAAFSSRPELKGTLSYLKNGN